MKRPKTVAIDLRAREAYPWLLGVCLAIPGLVLEDEGSGIRVRVREDGGLEEIIPGGHPHGGIAFDPTARRAP